VINPANIHHLFRIEASLKGYPANIQEFLAFSAKKGDFVHKSCIIAGFLNNGSKTEKNNVFLHHYWILSTKW